MTTPGPAESSDPGATKPIPPDIEEMDPGLARERTQMAWTRTAISFAAAGAAILKSHLVPGVIVLVLGMATWGLSRFFPGGPETGSRHRRLLVVTVAVTATSLVSLAVVLTTPLAHR
jgi:uncharacterized membrane protein YidH (DUF202 family)